MGAAMQFVDDPARLLAALTPLRRRLLTLLTEPSSATEAGAALGLTRQKANYHLRVLERAGLVELVEVRQRRGCTERVLRTSADAFVVDPAVMGRTADGVSDALASGDAFAAEHLVAMAGRAVREVARMHAAADERGKRLLTFTIETEVGFDEPGHVHEFTNALASAIAELSARYSSAGGRRYRLIVGGHPAAADGATSANTDSNPDTRHPTPSREPRGNSEMNDDTEAEPAAETGAEPVVIEVTIGTPIERVWAYLREPDLIRRWHGWLVDGLDEEIDYIYRRHAREAESPYVLELNRSAEGPWVDGGDRFELFDRSDGTEGTTTVRITRGSRGPDEMWDAWYDDITEGWTSFLNQLRFTLEHHPNAMRRTIFFTADGADLPSPRAALGISSVAPTESYVADAGGELDLRGRGWFVSEHQVGVSVDALGPGLVIAADKPDPVGAPKGAMVIVTTYGQDDADFAVTVRRWADWWMRRYPDAEGPHT